MVVVNKKRVMFREVVDAVNRRHTSGKAKAAFERFKDRYLSGMASWKLFLLHPIVSRRYEREKIELMANTILAVLATPITKEGVELSDGEINLARRQAFEEARTRQLLKAEVDGTLAINPEIIYEV